MSDGCSAVATVGTGSSQCPLTTTIARGRSGRLAGMLSRKARVLSHVPGGPMVHCIKKHGPPPWGRKMDGWRRNILFTHDLDDDALGSLSVELGVVDLLPRSEVQFAVGHGHNHLVMDDKALEV